MNPPSSDRSSSEHGVERAGPAELAIAPPSLSAPARPTTEKERITAIDALRGFALLGILLLNIQSFAMPGAAYMNPTAYGDLTGANYWVWFFTHLLGDQKFMTIFSMLFGAGIVLMASRIETAGRSATGIHYRRMAWLVLFGLLHAHLIWYGDILFYYGTCGMVAWWFRNLRPRTLLILGALSILVPVLISLASAFSMPYWGDEAIEGMQQGWAPDDTTLNAEIAAYQGTWLEQMSERVPTAIMFETFLLAIWGAWRAGGLMLVGMALFKLGVFSAARTRSFYMALVAAGVLIGLPITLFGMYRNFAVNWDVRYSFFIGSQYNYVASVLVSLAWVGMVMLMVKSGTMVWLQQSLAAVGRMALSNYLLQSVICTLIFYGHGLGYFGQVERTGQLAIVVAVWILQLVVSPLWLRQFQFGPMEWLWRTLTYLRVQPVLRRRDATTTISRLSSAG